MKKVPFNYLILLDWITYKHCYRLFFGSHHLTQYYKKTRAMHFERCCELIINDLGGLS